MQCAVAERSALVGANARNRVKFTGDIADGEWLAGGVNFADFARGERGEISNWDD